MYICTLGWLLPRSRNCLLAGLSWRGATPARACPKTEVKLDYIGLAQRFQASVHRGGDRRRPFLQVQNEPATPPTQQVPMQEAIPQVSSDDQLNSAPQQDEASEGVPLTPASVISSMQQLQLAESTPESLLLCQESLADSSSGQGKLLCQHPSDVRCANPPICAIKQVQGLLLCMP